jgi:hypothetical protein
MQTGTTSCAFQLSGKFANCPFLLGYLTPSPNDVDGPRKQQPALLRPSALASYQGGLLRPGRGLTLIPATAHLLAMTYPSGIRGGGLADKASHDESAYLSGGPNLVDLMKYNVTRPRHLTSLGHLPWHHLEALPSSGLRLGYLVINTATAYDAQVQACYPATLLPGAEPAHFVGGHAATAQCGPRRRHFQPAHSLPVLLRPGYPLGG